jgi:hypothetical protein
MFSRMTIRARLVGGFATLLGCLLGLGCFSLSAVDSLRGDLDEMANRTAQNPTGGRDQRLRRRRAR